MDSFTGKLAVVTGGGSGMGRELARQLAAQACSVAACDWHPETAAETAALARAGAPYDYAELFRSAPAAPGAGTPAR